MLEAADGRVDQLDTTICSNELAGHRGLDGRRNCNVVLWVFGFDVFDSGRACRLCELVICQSFIAGIDSPGVLVRAGTAANNREERPGAARSLA